MPSLKTRIDELSRVLRRTRRRAKGEWSPEQEARLRAILGAGPEVDFNTLVLNVTIAPELKFLSDAQLWDILQGREA